MKKRFAAILLSGAMVAGALSPLPAAGAEGNGISGRDFASAQAASLRSESGEEESQIKDQLLLERQGDVITIKLVMPYAADEKLSSLQMKLSIDGGTFSKFTFAPELAGVAKVTEAYAGDEKNKLDIYIAGTQPLYAQGSDTLVIGSVTAVKGEGNETTVHAGDVKVVRGIFLEDRDVSQSIRISEGSGSSDSSNGSSGYYPGATYPYQPTPPAQDNGEKPDNKPEDVLHPPTTQPTEPDKPQQPAEEKAIKKPALKEAKNAASGITIKWSKSSNASGYYVYRRASGGSWSRIAKVSGKNKTSYTDKAVKSKNGKAYFYTVKAYKGKKVSAYNKKGIKIYRLQAPSIKKLTGKSTKTAAKWQKNKKASGYQLQYARSSDFKKQKVTKKVKSVSKTSISISMKRGKTYYVRVRCYKKSEGKVYYSAWSKVKKKKA